MLKLWTPRSAAHRYRAAPHPENAGSRLVPVSLIWSPRGGENRQANPSRIPAAHVAAAAAKNPMSDWV
jgi:hypothetical protein